MDNQKECCNKNCNNIFYVPDHLRFQRDLCDKCKEILLYEEELLKENIIRYNGETLSNRTMD